MFSFDVMDLKPPYSLEAYQEAVNAAVNLKYDFLIIDSISHAWAGEGGILDQKSKMDARGGNSYVNWSKFTPVQEKFISMILQSDIHTIVTMRSKQDYILNQNSKGQSVPQKVGLAPIQREGMEYELTLVLDMDMKHQAQSSKDRTGLFKEEIFYPSIETGKMLKKWIEEGVEDNSVLLNAFRSGLKEYTSKKGLDVTEFLKSEFEKEPIEMSEVSCKDLEDYIVRLGELNET